MRSDEAIQRRREWVRSRVGRPQWRRGRVGPSGAPSGRLVAPSRWRFTGRQRGSRFLHRLGEFTAHAAAGLLAAAAVAGWLIVGAKVGYPGWWVTALDTVSASVTLVMVFAIQHTQARQQSATQRKLDELLRALPSADDRLIAVEEAPDDELEALADLNLADRHAAAEPPAAPAQPAASTAPGRQPNGSLYL
jgi:low affinity Fe/Cu permease